MVKDYQIHVGPFSETSEANRQLVILVKKEIYLVIFPDILDIAHMFLFTLS